MTLAETMEELATALEPVAQELPGLQVYAFLNSNPTPPSIDIYPGDPFQTGAGFGVPSAQVFFTVRGRVSTADNEAGQRQLLRMLDPGDAASVENALAAADAVVVPEGVTGFREYIEDTAANGRLLGCEWRVSVFL